MTVAVEKGDERFVDHIALSKASRSFTSSSVTALLNANGCSGIAAYQTTFREIPRTLAYTLFHEFLLK